MPDVIVNSVPPPDPAPTPTVSTGQAPQGQGQKEPGKFGRVIGSVLGGAVNVMAPAAGSLIGGLIRGGGLGFAADMERMMAQSAQNQMQLIGVQMRVQNQTEQFTTVSNLLKARHDGEMSAVQNFKS
ncbi:MAG TPA: hypothetical protein VFC61_11205 [Blastocatellia bacterium]|jgi:hypothetical protein|nr:hypothetical protein [Blastocatellia bacterium]